MDYHQRFRRAATEQGLPAAEAARFAELIRFRIRAGEQPAGVPAGQLGGRPRLPAETPWPSVAPGAPLAFMASVDCAALPRIAGLDLPAAGTLLFFLAPDAAVESCSIASEQQFARVVHVPAGAETVAAEAPDESHSGRDLYARVEADLPQWLDSAEEWRSDAQNTLIRELKHRAELGALVDRLWPGRIPWIGDDLLIGGYSISAQDSPETQLASENAADEPYLPPGRERLARSAEAEDRVVREWVPLAQFAVPHEEYVNGRFLIRFDDLAAGRFEQALSFCEFTE